MQRSRAELGFTLFEVLIALSMLAVVTLGLMSASARMLRGVTDDRTRTLAATSADARIARIRTWPTYATLDSAFAATEANTPAAGWTRTTTIVRTGGANQPNDYKRATVVVTGPGLPVPIERTVTLAAP